MKADALITALLLPPDSRVDRRVPKSLLIENGAPTAADKRAINDGIDGLLWIASLKPTTISVPAFRDATREYVEVAVLHLVLRSGARTQRLVELVHRAIPYPVLLACDTNAHAHLSVAHKRWSEGDASKTVIDGELVGVEVAATDHSEVTDSFLRAMALSALSRTTLFALYQGWVDALVALETSRVTGSFQAVSTAEHSAARRVALSELTRLEADMSRIRLQADRETQTARRVELNLELKRLEAAYAAAREKHDLGKRHEAVDPAGP